MRSFAGGMRETGSKTANITTPLITCTTPERDRDDDSDWCGTRDVGQNKNQRLEAGLKRPLLDEYSLLYS